jgi:hypothetical protein
MRVKPLQAVANMTLVNTFMLVAAVEPVYPDCGKPRLWPWMNALTVGPARHRPALRDSGEAGGMSCHMNEL